MKVKIEDSLNMVPLGDLTEEKKEVAEYKESSKENKSEKDSDLEFARENLYGLIAHGAASLEDLKDLAGQSQQPRAYEVLATMIKTLLDANKDLIDLTERKNKEKDEDKPAVTNNNLFIGSSSELLKLLKNNNDNGNS